VPLPPRIRKIKPRNVFNKDTDYFRKAEQMPSLFNLEIDKKLYDHLNNDDLDEVSKNEVVYKVLKEHLRQHQRKLIVMKEKDRLKKHENMLKRKAGRALSKDQLELFAKRVQ
jgi:hypothetical protein